MSRKLRVKTFLLRYENIESSSYLYWLCNFINAQPELCHLDKRFKNYLIEEKILKERCIFISSHFTTVFENWYPPTKIFRLMVLEDFLKKQGYK
jgi:hypothetical protein